jgi:hypothetical protein
MSDSEGSNFSDNESERGSNQQSESDVEVIEHLGLNGTTCSLYLLTPCWMMFRVWLLQTYVV